MSKLKPLSQTLSSTKRQGCQETLVSEDLVDYLWLVLDVRQKKRIKGIHGRRVQCLGSNTFQVTYDGQTTNVLALVTSSLNNEIVLSLKVLQRLGILLEDYQRRQFTKPNKSFNINEDNKEPLHDNIDLKGSNSPIACKHSQENCLCSLEGCQGRT